ncbi:hypothetical protein LLE49_06870 [Alicyclobacillus tolerans]|uniref:hypothetical protein n=1 Tax=Alicyclobacillus tolerans TaxID=90970 RepID=UPI001F3F20B8|nr:hypothetical protein [Alicyclobacillus tolerans]MCF8564468.1 hypothetical protein [Alicyclobacillus tolerans]
MKGLYLALFSGALLLLTFYMVKEISAKNPREREKYLEDEEAVATVAKTLLPLA